MHGSKIGRSRRSTGHSPPGFKGSKGARGEVDYLLTMSYSRMLFLAGLRKILYVLFMELREHNTVIVYVMYSYCGVMTCDIMISKL